jgi:phenylpropionate dioxygenase-like ring-hydroxylating dioxygenase large terminal subunit
MDHATQVALIDRLLAVHAGRAEPAIDGRLSTDAYTSTERAADEQRVVQSQPVVVAHTSALAEPGAFVTSDLPGVPLLVVRDADGIARVFRNSCRHRGARLVTEERGHAKKAFVCRYHSWTYDLGGRLTHLPCPAAFPTLDRAQCGLIEVPAEERHGFVWAVASGAGQPDVAAHLATIDAELTSFGLADHVAERTVTQTRACNWKLIVEAFLEGYHAPYLHQRTLARFFLPETVVYDLVGAHSRSAGGRRSLLEAPTLERARWDVRAYATLFYFLFPNTVLVFHPDWVSHIELFPRTPSTCSYVHTMLVPRAHAGDGARWDPTWRLIEETVFQREDLEIAESVQSTLGAPQAAAFHLGALEQPIAHFHHALDAAIPRAWPSRDRVS